jgi:excisionase family DNA binding protein
MNNEITCTVKEAMRRSGLGATTIYRLIDTGQLLALKVGARRLIRVDSLENLLAPASTPGLAAERGRSKAVNGEKPFAD